MIPPLFVSPMKWCHIFFFLKWNNMYHLFRFPQWNTPPPPPPPPVSPAKQPHFFFCFITSHFHSAGCQGKSFTAGCAVQANERFKNNDESTINRWHTLDMTPSELRICTNAFRSLKKKLKKIKEIKEKRDKYPLHIPPGHAPFHTP